MEIINDVLWGGIMLVLLFSVHLYFTASCKFPQRHIFRAIRNSFSGNTEGKSAFTCLTINLASTIGAGNIIGVAMAIVMGGPGAVFWCWITGVLGVATHYAESLICIRYRSKDSHGTYHGGPMYVLKQIGNSKAACVYASFAACCGLCIGSMVPANSIAETAKLTFGISPYIIAAAVSLLTGLVIIGGIKSIGNVCSRIMPAVIILYILAFITIIIRNFQFIPQSISMILNGAFNIRAGASGILGYNVGKAIRYGVSRSLFSNEAGMGSAGITASAMEHGKPENQAMISATATFWDTVVLAGITGFAFVTAIAAEPSTYNGLNGMELTIKIFDSLPDILSFSMPIMLIILGFSTIIGWCYIGEQAFSFLFKNTSIYRILWLIAAFTGCIMSLNAVWELCDILNIFMILPNIFALWRLRKIPQKSEIKLLRNTQSTKHLRKNLLEVNKSQCLKF